MDLRTMKLPALVAEAIRIRKRICGLYCDQLGGYHQIDCHVLGYIRYGQEKRVTYIRKYLALIKKKAKNSIHGEL